MVRGQIGACLADWRRLGCWHEPIYPYGTNEGAAEAGPRILRSRADLFDFGPGVCLPRGVYRGGHAVCGAYELCARRRQAVFARVTGEPADEGAVERAVLSERDAAGRYCVLADGHG